MSAADRPLAFLLVDGLSLATAAGLPWVMELAGEPGSRWWEVEAALPSISYTNYATIASGLPPARHGLVDNERRAALGDHVFRSLAEAGIRAAMVAYAWCGDLLGPHVPPHRFYAADETPDAWVFAEARRLTEEVSPQFLLVHPMGVDYAGHLHGGRSLAYGQAALALSQEARAFTSFWRAEGGDVLLGADHGMGEDGRHGGDSRLEREVLYLLLAGGRAGMPLSPLHHQHDVRRVIETLLGVRR